MTEYRYIKKDGSYHKLRPGTNIAMCGVGRAGVNGYEIVIKLKRPILSMICHNCRSGIVVRQVDNEEQA
jgi:hypothetical protein